MDTICRRTRNPIKRLLDPIFQTRINKYIAFHKTYTNPAKLHFELYYINKKNGKDLKYILHFSAYIAAILFPETIMTMSSFGLYRADNGAFSVVAKHVRKKTRGTLCADDHNKTCLWRLFCVWCRRQIDMRCVIFPSEGFLFVSGYSEIYVYCVFADISNARRCLPICIRKAFHIIDNGITTLGLGARFKHSPSITMYSVIQLY